MQVEYKPKVVLFLDIDGVLAASLTLAEKIRYQKIVNELFSSGSIHTDHDRVPKTCKLCCQAKAYLFKDDAVCALEELISRIEKIAEVHIVISSAWRMYRTVEELKEIFQMHQFSNNIVDKTVDGLPYGRAKEYCSDLHLEPTEEEYVNDKTNSEEKTIIGLGLYCRQRQQCRASQIGLWIKEHPEYAGYVIFDDIDDHLSGTFGEKFISTAENKILTPDDIDKAYDILTKQLEVAELI